MRDRLGPIHCAVIRALATPGDPQTFREGQYTANYVPEMTIRVPEDAEVKFADRPGRHPLEGAVISYFPQDDE